MSAQPTSKRRQIGLDLLKGVLLIALLVGLKLIFEHTPAGEYLERAGYDLLQKQLSSADSVPVVVVDLSALEPQEFNVNGQIGIATPRERLQELITAATEAKARVIGVDIDFSPGPTGYMYPNDPQFFEFCLRNKVPVVLGISRTESLTPDKWLGSKDYQSLAASMIVPNDTRKMPKWISVEKHAAHGPTLGAALAERFQQAESRLAKWLHEYQLVEQVSEKELGQGVVVGEFPVDYSPLKTLIDKTLTTANPVVVKDQAHLLRDKIVLFGRGKLNNDGDRFTVEGFAHQVPGAYVHASAAYTLHNARLYELTSGSRLGIDVVLSLIVLFLVIAFRYHFGLDHHLLQIVFTAIVIVLALILGVAFVAQTRILWTDFILVLALLILHVPVEQKAAGAFRKIVQGVTTKWTCWLFALVFMLTVPFVAVAQEAGIIEEVRGNAYWKKDARSTRVKLHARRDKGRILRADERVRCEPQSELRLRLYKRALSVPCGPTWFPIPYVQSDKDHPARLALVEYGRRGGGDRGSSSIYSPANRASVIPEMFEIRWITNLEPVKSVLIKEASPSGREIFQQNVVDGMSGYISSEGARQALVEYKEKRGHGPLLLILADSRRRDLAGVRFFLISEKAERDLDQELRSWKNEPEGIWRHLGIAHAFTARQMFTEAAEEYEAALKFAPDSIDLLKRTIAAHQRTGNTLREKELSAHLANASFRK